MTRESTEDPSVGPALRRVLAQAGGPELLDLLTDELSGTDLTTLLLEVFRRRANRVTPAEVMRRYRTDRFVAPAPTAITALRRTEDMLLSALPDGFQTLVLAPVVPLAHSAVATVDPRKVIATIRGSEVAADPTNALALEAAQRRSQALAADPRSTAPVRLAASQRVVRAQHFDATPGRLAHFQLFAMVTAGRDTVTPLAPNRSPASPEAIGDPQVLTLTLRPRNSTTLGSASAELVSAPIWRGSRNRC